MEPTAFLDLNTLGSLAGQVMAVGMITQAIKAAVPVLVSPFRLRATSIVAGIGIHAALVWQAGMPVSAYVLAVLNGTMVAMSAMKAAELIKGE